MDSMALLWIILIVFVAAAVAFLVYRVERKRKEALRRLAPQAVEPGGASGVP